MYLICVIENPRRMCLKLLTAIASGEQRERLRLSAQIVPFELFVVSIAVVMENTFFLQLKKCMCIWGEKGKELTKDATL